MQTDFVKFREFPINLNTLGWWWLNYSNVADVYYISGFNAPGGSGIIGGLSSPVWSPLTLDILENVVSSGRKIICKIYNFENKAYGVIRKNKFLNIPTLNECFIIEPPDALQITSLEQEQQFSSFSIEDDADARQSSNKSLELVYQNFGKDINSELITDRTVIKNVNASRLKENDSELNFLVERGAAAPNTTNRSVDAPPRPTQTAAAPTRASTRASTRTTSTRNTSGY